MEGSVPYPSILDFFFKAGVTWEAKIQTSRMPAQLILRTVFLSLYRGRLNRKRPGEPPGRLWSSI